MTNRRKIYRIYRYYQGSSFRLHGFFHLLSATAKSLPSSLLCSRIVTHKIILGYQDFSTSNCQFFSHFFQGFSSSSHLIFEWGRIWWWFFKYDNIVVLHSSRSFFLIFVIILISFFDAEILRFWDFWVLSNFFFGFRKHFSTTHNFESVFVIERQ